MKVIFNNGEKEYYILRAIESLNIQQNNETKLTLSIYFPLNNEIFNEFLNYNNNNKINNIDIFDNINQNIVYSTSKLIKLNNYFKNITDNGISSNYIQINFINEE